MSSHAPAPRRRALPLTALCLAAALVLVLAVGAWAHWRPLSDADAARLSARATVDAVRTGVDHDTRLLTDDALARQLAALGPAATPAQQRRLADRGDTAPAPESLDDAADRMARTATTTDGDLAATAGAVAASWWAAAARGGGNGTANPGVENPGTGVRSASAPASGGPTAGNATTGATDPISPAADPTSPARGADQDSPGCSAELRAALTALDRAGFVADAAEARLGDGATAGRTVETAAGTTSRALEDSRVLPLLGCDPPPAQGFYRLPGRFREDPARAAGAAQREAGEALVRALAASSPEDVRAWTVASLRDTARTAQALVPQQPVAALPGRS